MAAIVITILPLARLSSSLCHCY